jgi:hypothetical protein
VTEDKRIEIPMFRLRPEPLSTEAEQLAGFKWAGSDVGKRHKLGGRPDQPAPASYPACPGCGEEMSFYGQLDSINDDFCIGDAGLIHVFLCFDCLEALAVVAST